MGASAYGSSSRGCCRGTVVLVEVGMLVLVVVVVVVVAVVGSPTKLDLSLACFLPRGICTRG